MNDQLELIQLMLDDLRYRNPSSFYHKELIIEDAKKDDVFGIKATLAEIQAHLKALLTEKYEGDSAAIALMAQQVEQLYNLNCENAASVQNSIEGNLIVQKVDGDFAGILEQINQLKELVPGLGSPAPTEPVEPQEPEVEVIPDKITVNGFEVNNKLKALPVLVSEQADATYSTLPNTSVYVDYFEGMTTGDKKPHEFTAGLKYEPQYNLAGIDNHPSFIKWNHFLWSDSKDLIPSMAIDKSSNYVVRTYGRDGQAKPIDFSQKVNLERLSLGFSTGLNALASPQPHLDYNPFGLKNEVENYAEGKYKVVFKGCGFPAACFVTNPNNPYNLSLARVTHWERVDGDTIAYVETHQVSYNQYVTPNTKIYLKNLPKFNVVLLGDGEAITRAFDKDEKIIASIYSNGGDEDFFWSNIADEVSEDRRKILGETSHPEFNGNKTETKYGSCKMVQLHSEGDLLLSHPKKLRKYHETGFNIKAFNFNTGEDLTDLSQIKRSLIFVGRLIQE